MTSVAPRAMRPRRHGNRRRLQRLGDSGFCRLRLRALRRHSRTSFWTMRPPGPEPLICERSTPLSVGDPLRQRRDANSPPSPLPIRSAADAAARVDRARASRRGRLSSGSCISPVLASFERRRVAPPRPPSSDASAAGAASRFARRRFGCRLRLCGLPDAFALPPRVLLLHLVDVLLPRREDRDRLRRRRPSSPSGRRICASVPPSNDFHLHRRLVGLDLGDHLAGLDLVALLLEPLDDRALGHGVGELGHGDFDGHGELRMQRSKVTQASLHALSTRSAVADFLHRRDDPVDARHHRFFEVVVERHGDLVAVDVLDRGVEVVEARLLDLVAGCPRPCRSSPSLRRRSRSGWSS